MLFFLFANKHTRGKDTAGHDKACFPYLSFDAAVCLRSLSVRDKAVLLGLYFHESGAYTKRKQRLELTLWLCVVSDNGCEQKS